eukprot:6555195-Prymnesium_polylepis.1
MISEYRACEAASNLAPERTKSRWIRSTCHWNATQGGTGAERKADRSPRSPVWVISQYQPALLDGERAAVVVVAAEAVVDRGDPRKQARERGHFAAVRRQQRGQLELHRLELRRRVRRAEIREDGARLPEHATTAIECGD